MPMPLVPNFHHLMDPRPFGAIPESDDGVLGNDIFGPAQNTAPVYNIWSAESPLTSYSGSQSDDLSSDMGMSSSSQDATDLVFDDIADLVPDDVEQFEYVETCTFLYASGDHKASIPLTPQVAL